MFVVVVVFCGSSAEAGISMCVKLLLIVYDVVTFVVINVFWLLCRGGKYECVWNCCHPARARSARARRACALRALGLFQALALRALGLLLADGTPTVGGGKTF